MATTQAKWAPAQAKAWDGWMVAEYSAVYWGYVVAHLGKVVVGLNESASQKEAIPIADRRFSIMIAIRG